MPFASIYGSEEEQWRSRTSSRIISSHPESIYLLQIIQSVVGGSECLGSDLLADRDGCTCSIWHRGLVSCHGLDGEAATGEARNGPRVLAARNSAAGLDLDAVDKDLYLTYSTGIRGADGDLDVAL